MEVSTGLLNGWDPGIIEAALKQVEDLDSRAAKLIVAADNYDLMDLKTLCE